MRFTVFIFSLLTIISVLPHITLFLRHGGDFVGYFLRGELDVVHEGLLGLVSADVRHLDNGEFVEEIHIGDATASGCVGGHTFIARAS